MTTLTFSSGGCPSYPFYPLKRVPSYPILAENPSSEGATKDHLSPHKGNPPELKIKVDVSQVDVKPGQLEDTHVLGALRRATGVSQALRARNPKRVRKSLPPFVPEKSRKCPFETFSRLLGTLGPEAPGDFFQATKTCINIKNFNRNPPTQTLPPVV